MQPSIKEYKKKLEGVTNLYLTDFSKHGDRIKKWARQQENIVTCFSLWNFHDTSSLQVDLSFTWNASTSTHNFAELRPNTTSNLPEAVYLDVPDLFCADQQLVETWHCLCETEKSSMKLC